MLAARLNVCVRARERKQTKSEKVGIIKSIGARQRRHQHRNSLVASIACRTLFRFVVDHARILLPIAKSDYCRETARGGRERAVTNGHFAWTRIGAAKSETILISAFVHEILIKLAHFGRRRYSRSQRSPRAYQSVRVDRVQLLLRCLGECALAALYRSCAHIRAAYIIRERGKEHIGGIKIFLLRHYLCSAVLERLRRALLPRSARQLNKCFGSESHFSTVRSFCFLAVLI